MTKSQPNHNAINNEIIAALDIPAEYAELGVRVAKDKPNATGWIVCHAVDREDSDPSAAINTRTGRYKDHGGDGLSLSLWDFAAQFGNGRFADWQAARKYYAKKSKISLGRASAVKVADQLLWQPWNDTLVTLWTHSKPGVTLESVKAAGGRLAMYPKKTRASLVVALPIFGPMLTDADPVGWVVWHAGGGPLPKFNRKGKITGYVKMKTVYGSQSGLMGQYAAARLGSGQRNEKCVWLVAGPTDMMALWAAIPPELRETHLVVANSGGEAENVKDDIAAIFAGRRVLLVRDNDDTGKIGAAKWLDGVGPPVARDIRHVELPEPYKDLRESLTT